MKIWNRVSQRNKKYAILFPWEASVFPRTVVKGVVYKNLLQTHGVAKCLSKHILVHSQQ